MKALKTSLTASALVLALASPFMADSIEDSSAQPFDLSDHSLLFGKGVAMMQFATLSQQEMVETEGDWWPVIYRVGGGLTGMYSTGYGYLAGDGRDPFQFFGAAATGFTGGLWSPINGYRSAISTAGAGFTSGALGGFRSSRGWW